MSSDTRISARQWAPTSPPRAASACSTSSLRWSGYGRTSAGSAAIRISGRSSGQPGGGRKVATLMAMPGAKNLFHRAIIESGAVLRLTTHEDAVKQTDLLLGELG